MACWRIHHRCFFSSKLNLQWVGEISNFHKLPRLPEGISHRILIQMVPDHQDSGLHCWDLRHVETQQLFFLGHVSHSVLHVTCLDAFGHIWRGKNIQKRLSYPGLVPTFCLVPAQLPNCPSVPTGLALGGKEDVVQAAGQWTRGQLDGGASALRMGERTELVWDAVSPQHYVEVKLEVIWNFRGLNQEILGWFFIFERVWWFCAENRRVDIAFWNPSWLAVRLVCPRSGGIRLT
jgi:hypothetical protein